LKSISKNDEFEAVEKSIQNLSSEIFQFFCSGFASNQRNLSFWWKSANITLSFCFFHAGIDIKI
jgi:hypothetical protein